MDSPLRPMTPASVPRSYSDSRGLDPNIFDLAELVGKERPETKRFADDEIVSIVKDARFISIRQSAPVA